MGAIEAVLAYLPLAIRLMGAGTDLVARIHALTTKPGGPTPADLAQLEAEFDMADGALAAKLTGNAG